VKTGPIICSRRDCKKGLHYFRRTRPGEESYRNGECVECGANPVDWDRLDRHDLNDVEYTVSALNFEWIRHHFWTDARIDEVAVRHASKKGAGELKIWAENRLVSSIGPPSKDIFRDGAQTPMFGRVVYYAQHATACCCRKCLEEWHGFDRRVPLRSNQLEYLTDLVMTYVDRRLPGLPP
jgi:Domain of unknown function (DUF4186)